VAQLLKQVNSNTSFTKTNNMEHPTKLLTLKPFFVMLFLSLFSLTVWSQENQGSSGGESSTTTTTTKKTSVSISANDNTGANAWYTSPWVWVVGAAVFILLLVALLSNRGRDTVTTSDRVQVSKTTERDGGRHT
jgi:hypothetical protein